MGTALGLVFGIGLAVNINEIVRGLETLRSVLARLLSSGASGPLFNASYYLEVIPIRLSSYEVYGVALFSLLLSLFSSLLPASSAARLKPLDVLRKH